MSIVNFRKQSQEKLRILVGKTATEEDRRRERTSDTFVEKNYYKVTEIVTGTFIGSEDTYTEYKAVQVDPDGTEVENGVIFDSDQTPTNDIDKPTYLSNLQINEELFSGTVELDKAYQVEEIDGDEFGDDPRYYIIPKGGAGGGIFRLKSKESNLVEYSILTEVGFDLIDDLDNILEVDVPVIQRKFFQCEFYENEILYAKLDGNGAYDLSPFMSGVGVGNA